MQSDSRGAFLTGVVGGSGDGERWTLAGADIVRGLRIECAGSTLVPADLDSSMILPFETVRYYRGGYSVAISGLDPFGGTDEHGFVVRVVLPHPARVVLHLSAAGGSPLPVQGQTWTMQLAGGGKLCLAAGDAGRAVEDGVALEGAAKAAFLVCALPSGADEPAVVRALYPRVDSLLSARRARMQGILNAAYFRTSDDTLDKAVRWMMLALDGLVVEGRDTFAVDGVPWDGSIDVRDNAQSIAGLGLAAGQFSRTAAILRSLAHYQDTLRGSTSFGRLPDRVVNGRPAYNGADVTPWYVRELYEQVVNTDDTALARRLYPLIVRSIDGTLRTHADTGNLLVHGPRETWMKDVARGNRAAEIQVSWYFQQLIGRFVASFMGDTAAELRWEDLPEKTERNFTALFSDTAAHTIADHLEADGSRSADVRPNAVMCLEMLDDEVMRHGVTRAAVAGLFAPDGVRTLAPSDPRYALSPGKPGWEYNGPVWTWLAGPMCYALTRADRQDVSYALTKRMAATALGSGMAGTLPAIAGAPGASLTGMSEFIRSVYQDYFGLRVDLASGTIVLQPRLPASLTEVQFTAYAGDFPVEVEYTKNTENTRLYLNAPSLPRELTVSMLWMMDNGDAWRGSFRLTGGTPAAIMLGDDDAVLYQGESRGEFEAKRKLKGFSRRAEGFDLSPAP
ncbi:MAG TPA: amylo-alpha-1,6-glucosidase [Bacteroidota bacterium]|nr:amylo-alpha-1,6-glucosidase [Bacteroidota bacterium]